MKILIFFKTATIFLVLFLFISSFSFAQDNPNKKTETIKKEVTVKTAKDVKKACEKKYKTSECTDAKVKDAKMTGMKNCPGDCKAKHGAMMKTKLSETATTKVTETDTEAHICKGKKTNCDKVKS
ncbi:hypothetical protein BMS3Abin04_02395 [bacterium BMS3Abin04]|nr:hypothetical protein BMS3Abin04_02395 [bacterium BMS3Abin04]